MTIDVLNDAIRHRRVVRNMTDRPIPSDELDLIMRSAHFAPSAGNRRIQTLTPVADERMLRLLREVSPGMFPVPRAAIVIGIDLDRAAHFGMDRSTPGLYVDVGTLAMTIMLSAMGRGIGSCPTASFSRAAAARLLGFDANTLPWLIMCLGYPAAAQPDAFSVGTT